MVEDTDTENQNLQDKLMSGYEWYGRFFIEYQKASLLPGGTAMQDDVLDAAKRAACIENGSL